jgi:Sulfotransferase domain
MAIDNPSTPKHIAMWSCPRSRSTLIARSFGQLDGCIVYDEPLYAPYLVNEGLDHPERDAVIARRQTNYDQVISQLMGDLPSGASFSFQKHIAKHLRPDDSQEWLQSLKHFFLIRHPKEIIQSYQKICTTVTDRDIGIEALFQVFKTIESFSGQPPLVVEANDLIKNPRSFLNQICLHLGIPFSDQMLSWEPGMTPKSTIATPPFPWLWTGELPLTNWYSKIHRSTGFIPCQEEPEINLADELMPVLESCLPFYHKLYQYRLCLDNQ